jgi:hypothetical protein
MSAFTDAEISYMKTQRLGRLATDGADGQPHVVLATSAITRRKMQLKLEATTASPNERNTGMLSTIRAWLS